MMVRMFGKSIRVSDSRARNLKAGDPMTHPAPARRPLPAAMIAAIAALLLACTALVAGCSAQPDASPSSPAPSPSAQAPEQAEPLTVASLKGPTTIGLAAMVADQEGADEPYAFQMAATADEIAPKLSSGECDIALIPANLAATLYQRTGGAVRVIDVNTLGVLYGLTANEELKANPAPALADLAGRTVYLTGKGTVPQYTMECLLQAAGVADSVTLEFRSEPSEVVAMIQQNPAAVGIVPQPFATAALAQDDSLASVFDLTALWDDAFADAADGREAGRLITGVTVARAEVVEQQPAAIARFLAAHSASAAEAADDPGAVAPEVVELGIMGNAALAEKAIPLCNIVCLTGDDMKSALSGYLERLYELAPEALGGALPGDDFYYLG